MNRAEKMHDSAGWHIHSQLQEASAETLPPAHTHKRGKKPEPMPAGLAGEDPQAFPLHFGSTVNRCLPTQTGTVTLHTTYVAQLFPT